MATRSSKSVGVDPAKPAGTGTKPARSTATAARPQRAEPRLLPPYKVILHNDDKNDFDHVIATIMMLCGLNKQDAELRTVEAHSTGCALLLVTHRERAELFVEQFQSRSLTVTIEPAE
jgi:ATP-dependent Clp protease adaptor protein ClpS